MSHEKQIQAGNGWSMLGTSLLVLLVGIASTVGTIILAANLGDGFAFLLFLTIPILVVGIILLCGFFAQEPNEARAMLLFGEYRGIVRDSGFFWANPFYTKQRVSLRSRNMETQRLKVNDKRGNPIEIGAVVVWRVQDTAKALFDVEKYEQYVHVQSESALRHLANSYSYDHGEEGEITLRSRVDEVSETLRLELQERLGKAGVVVEEARLTHLAYASEIAGAMLLRQ